MKKSCGIFLIGLIVTCALAQRAHGASPLFVFWQPGGEGTAEAATPLLSAWATHFNAASSNAMSWRVQYWNHDLSSNTGALKKANPTALLINWDSYLRLIKSHSLTIMLNAKSLPTGDGRTHYVLWSATDKPVGIKLSEPLSEAFVRDMILKVSLEAYQTQPLSYEQMSLQALKAMANGDTSAILLNAFEDDVLTRMTAPWVKQLKRLGASPSVPAPVVVRLDDGSKKTSVEALKKTLLQMHTTEDGRDLLKAFRLVGFEDVDAHKTQVN